MKKPSVQYNAEILEDLIEKESREDKLTVKEFLALNNILLHLQVTGVYKLQEKYKETI